jgi:hypothetical protein
MRRLIVLGSFLLAGLFTVVDPTPAAALVRYVASHGVDSATCGTAVAPCRSISRAIARAVAGDRIIVGPGLYGDIDGDGRYVTPGDEGADGPCSCGVSITKAVTIESSAGAAATVIQPVSLFAVQITAPGAVFGGRDRGFTVRALNIGIDVDAGDVTVQDNRITGGDEGISVRIGANAASIVGNVVTDVKQTGAAILGDGAVISGNVFEHIGTAILVMGSATVIADNHVVNSLGTGIAVFGHDTTIRRNLLAGNYGPAVWVVGGGGGASVAGTVVTSNNFAHNGTFVERTLGGNCGVISQVSVVNAERNFWGSAQGPGADPADRACSPGALIDTAPFLTRPVAITSRTGR